MKNIHNLKGKKCKQEMFSGKVKERVFEVSGDQNWNSDSESNIIEKEWCLQETMLECLSININGVEKDFKRAWVRNMVLKNQVTFAGEKEPAIMQ